MWKGLMICTAALVVVTVLQVLYDVRGFLEKNRDTFRDDILNMLKDSRYACQEATSVGQNWATSM